MNGIQFLRQFKIGPFAIFDTVTAYLGVLILSPLLSKLFAKFGLKVPLSAWLWFTLPLSILFHIAAGQDTPLIKVLANPHETQFYIVITVLIFMVYMGMRKVGKIKVKPRIG